VESNPSNEGQIFLLDVLSGENPSDKGTAEKRLAE
jgi:hypothetical protein